MPGLVDNHAHFLLAAHSSLNAELRPAKDIPQILSILKEHARTLPAGVWIEGQGFRVPLLKEGRFPTKEELDTVSTTTPVFIQDASGHHVAVNSLLLKQLNVTKDTPDPAGASVCGDTSLDIKECAIPDAHMHHAAMRPCARRLVTLLHVLATWLSIL
jgi:predicted amidohydrolase YtcJ